MTSLKENIEKLFEENDLQPISCPRPSSKRGGGCAVIVNLKKFTVEKLSVRRLKRFLWQVFIPRLTKEKKRNYVTTFDRKDAAADKIFQGWISV